MKSNIEVKNNEKYGEWTVIDQTPMKSNFGNVYVLCKCTCGTISKIMRCRLKDGKTKGCKKCSSSRNKQALGKGKHKGCGEVSKEIFKRIKRHSQDRRRKDISKMPFTITIEYIWDLYVKQKGICAISGLPLMLHLKGKKVTSHDYFSYVTASLDRIDSNIGYIPGNVQWVHKWVNIMKNSMSDEQLKYICQTIYFYNKDNFEPSLVNVDFLQKVSRKVQRLTDDSSTLNNSDTRIRHPQSEGDDIV